MTLDVLREKRSSCSKNKFKISNHLFLSKMINILQAKFILLPPPPILSNYFETFDCIFCCFCLFICLLFFFKFLNNHSFSICVPICQLTQIYYRRHKSLTEFQVKVKCYRISYRMHILCITINRFCRRQLIRIEKLTDPSAEGQTFS